MSAEPIPDAPKHSEALVAITEAHIRAVVGNSRSWREVARRLAVNDSTVWRWRKRGAIPDVFAQLTEAEVGAIIKSIRRQVRWYAERRAWNLAGLTARDLETNALTAAWLALRKSRPFWGKERAFAWTAARQEIEKHVRREHRRGGSSRGGRGYALALTFYEVTDVDHTNDPQDFDRNAVDAWWRSVAVHLTHPQRCVVEMVYWHDFSVTRAARSLGLSLADAQRTLEEAFKRLRQLSTVAELREGLKSLRGGEPNRADAGIRVPHVSQGRGSVVKIRRAE